MLIIMGSDKVAFINNILSGLSDHIPLMIGRDVTRGLPYKQEFHEQSQ
jgi:hypothetical protein